MLYHIAGRLVLKLRPIKSSTSVSQAAAAQIFGAPAGVPDAAASGTHTGKNIVPAEPRRLLLLFISPVYVGHAAIPFAFQRLFKAVQI